MIASLRTLAREAWVLGIACAAALAYAVVTFIQAVVTFLLQLIDGQPVYDLPGNSQEEQVFNLFRDQAYAFVFRDHYVYYGPLLEAALVLIIVVAAVALLLHATTRDADPENGNM